MSRAVIFYVDGVLIHGYHSDPKRVRAWDINLLADTGVDPDRFRQEFIFDIFLKKEIVGQTTRRTFQIESKGKVLDVVHTGVAPDTFKDQSEAVVKGEVKQENGKLVMYAVPGEPGIMAKCPSKYNGKR